jgi:hypothetical protein
MMFVGGDKGEDWQAMAAVLSGTQKQVCEICWKECKRREAISCSDCGGVVHVACALPGIKFKRTAAFGDHMCDACMEFTIMEGIDKEGVAAPEAAGRAAELARKAQRLESGALAPDSHGTYATGLAQFEKFITNELKLDPDEFWKSLDFKGCKDEAGRAKVLHRREQLWRTLAWFIARASEKTDKGKQKLLYSSCTTYLNGGIATKLRELGVPAEQGTGHWRLKRVLAGLRRQQGDDGIETKQATSMDTELLQAIVRELLEGRVPDVKGDGTMGKYEREQAAFVLLLEFAGLARRSEMAGLEWERIERIGGHLRVQWSAAGYRRAKSDQESRGSESWVPVEVLGFDLAELMEGLRTQQKAAHAGLGQGRYYVLRDVRRLNLPWADKGEAINRMLKRVVTHTLKVSGLKRPAAATYSSHSLRRGGAQHMRDMGVPRDLIKLAGRWKSDAVDEYMQTACAEARRSVTEVFRKAERKIWQV